MNFTNSTNSTNDTNATWRVDYIPPKIATHLVGAPRFGHTTDFTVLFSGDQAQKQDYIAGLLFLGLIVAIFFVAWHILLIFFMCCGRHRVGFLSGRPFHDALKVDSEETQQEPETPAHAPSGGASVISDLYFDEATASPGRTAEGPVDTSFAQSATSNNNNYINATAQNPRPNRVRMAFIGSGIVFIAFAILMVTQGITNLQSTVDTLNGSANSVDDLATEGLSFINSGLRSVRSTAVTLRDQIVYELNATNFCPADPTLAEAASGPEVQSLASNAVNYLDKLDDFIASQVDSLESAMEQTQKGAQTVADGTSQIDLTDWESLIVLIPFTIIPCLLVAGAILAYFDVNVPQFDCFLRWFVFPLFFIMVMACWVVASIMIIGASANSDFCLPGGRQNEDLGPDQSVLQIVNYAGYGNDTYVGQIVKYYVFQCVAGNDPFDFLDSYLPDLQDASSTLDQLYGQLSDETVLSELSLYCNRDFAPVEEMVSNMRSIVAISVSAIQRTMDLIACSNIVPIYTNTFYEASCTYSVRAVYWVFASSLIMGFFGMIMVTFRSSFKRTIYDGDIDNDQTVSQSRQGDKAGKFPETQSTYETDGINDYVEHYEEPSNPTKNEESFDLRGDNESFGEDFDDIYAGHSIHNQAEWK